MPTAYEIFHDTTFGYFLRAVFGSSALPYPDEKDLPAVWNHAVHRQSSVSPTPQEKVSPRNCKTGDSRHEVSEALAAENSVVSQSQLEVPGGVERECTSTNGSDLTRASSASSGEKTLEKAEPGKDRLLVGWYGPDDADNPQNWTFGKKTWVMMLTNGLNFAVYMGSAIYVGGVPDIQKVFGVSDVAATLGLSLFVVGYGLGPALWAPLGEIPQIGRMPIYMITLLLFVLCHIPLALATNFGMLLAFRFLTGFFGSTIISVGGATMGDIYAPQHRVYGIWLWCYVATMGPVIGPIIGCYAGFYKGWTWTMWEEMWIAGFTLVYLFFFFPETNPSSILYQRARRLRKATGNKNLRSQPEIDAANIHFKDVVMTSLIRPLTLNFTEPVVLLVSIWLGLVYGLLYLWFESFPIVFMGVYNWEFKNLGWAYVGIGAGTTISTPLFFAWWHYVQEPKFVKSGGNPKPEEVLPAGIVGAFLIPICLFWFGWTARSSVHWVVPIIGSSLYGAAVTLLFTNILDYLANAYPLYAASVLAANALVRCGCAAAFPIFGRAMYNTLGIAWASSLLSFLGLIFTPIPILFYYYGPAIRRMSKRARHD